MCGCTLSMDGFVSFHIQLLRIFTFKHDIADKRSVLDANAMSEL